ncbi:MAG TPA: hypothetical protein PL185_12830 [Flavobacteriales bacterium]|nr:hypothetical protein [Flavobacteriales bacterium]
MSEHEVPENDAALTELFNEVQHVLSFSEKRDLETLQLFGLGSSVSSGKNARFKEGSLHQYYREDQIRSICVRYRLRFLPVKLYSGEVPYEVVSLIKKHDHIHTERDNQYYILASVAFFLAKDPYAAPLLFSLSEDGRYELICQWGKEMPWYIPIIKYPYRDFRSMVFSSLIFGLTIVTLSSLLGHFDTSNIFKSILIQVPILVLFAGVFSTLALCWGLVTHTDFSSDNWNSRFFR